MSQYSRTTKRQKHGIQFQIKDFGLCIVLLVTFITAGFAQQVHACGGTPPPWDCGKAYVFTKNGNFQVVADAVEVIDMPVTTFHFVNLVENIFSPTGCPDPVSVSMQAFLECDPPPSAGPIDLGTFPVKVGHNMIEINVPIAPGPARLCEFEIVSVLTFSDGSTLTQTAGNWACIAEECEACMATGEREPVADVEIEIISGHVMTAAPGDERQICVRVKNNEDVPFEGFISAETRQRGVPPQDSTGDTPTSGPHSPADPVGDAFPVVVETEGECVPLPENPHEQFEDCVFLDISLEPGEEQIYKFRVRSWPLCANGSCSRVIFDLTDVSIGEFVGCAETSLVVDSSQLPAFLWDDSGRVAQLLPVTTPNGNGIGMLLNPTLDGSQQSQINIVPDIANAQILVDGREPAGFTQFPTAVTQMDGNTWRTVLDWSFISPLIEFLSSVELSVPWKVTVDPSSEGDIKITDVQVETIDGAPTGVPNAPIRKVMAQIEGVGEGFDSFQVQWLQTTSIVGVETGGSFTLVPATEIIPGGERIFADGFESGDIAAWSSGGPESRGDEEGPTHAPFLGVSMAVDIRGFAFKAVGAAACPQDIDSDGIVGPADLAQLLGAWGPNPGHPADFDGNGIVGPPDLAQSLGAWGSCI